MTNKQIVCIIYLFIWLIKRKKERKNMKKGVATCKLQSGKDSHKTRRRYFGVGPGDEAGAKWVLFFSFLLKPEPD